MKTQADDSKFQAYHLKTGSRDPVPYSHLVAEASGGHDLLLLWLLLLLAGTLLRSRKTTARIAASVRRCRTRRTIVAGSAAVAAVGNDDQFFFRMIVVVVFPGVRVVLDRPRRPGMSHQRLQQFPRRAAGDFDRVIPVRGRHGFSVGRKGDRYGRYRLAAGVRGLLLLMNCREFGIASGIGVCCAVLVRIITSLAMTPCRFVW